MRKLLLAVITALALLGAFLVPATSASAASPTDEFFQYTGSTPLAQIAPGTPLKTRVVNYSIQGLPLPLKAIQILFRTTDALGNPVVSATTVVHPLGAKAPITKVLSYQSFYDSLNPADQPSVAIAGGAGLGPAIANVETLIFAPLLLMGQAINIPDTEGQKADFAAGPEYGRNTLDSLRAISQTTDSGIATDPQIVLMGYSGGAIASEWAAEMAPGYAPDVNKNIIGTAIGGVLVDPAHNLDYVGGSLVWAGVIPMALVGISRSYQVDLTQYLNAYGKSVVTKMQKASISQVLAAYPGLTWQKIALPQYSDPTKIPIYVDSVNKLIMGRSGTPSAPMLIGQGNGGYLEGTPPSTHYGPGDGVMIAGDVRTLARNYCDRGVTVKYTEYPLSHFTSVAFWLPQAYGWIVNRFAGHDAPTSCGSIKAGNSVEPISLATATAKAPKIAAKAPQQPLAGSVPVAPRTGL